MRPACALPSWRQAFAAVTSRYGESRNSIVFPPESMAGLSWVDQAGNANVRFIHAPRTTQIYHISDRIRSCSALAHTGAPNRRCRVIDHKATLGHHFLEIAITQRIPPIT